MGVKLKITRVSTSIIKPQNEDCYLSQISEKTMVGAMIVRAMIVRAMKKSYLVSAGPADICRRDTVCEQLISKSRIFRRILLSGTVI